MKESYLQNKIAKYLQDAWECLVIKQESVSLIGIPDLLVIHKRTNMHFWIEVKTTSGKLSTSQKTCHKYLQECNQKIFVCRSTGDAEDALCSVLRI